MSDKATQHQFRVKVSGINGTFNTFSGGGMERESSISWKGGSGTYDTLSGPATYTNIEISKDYEHADAGWIKAWSDGTRVRRANISVQPLDENGFAKGKPTTYADCLLLTVTRPEVEAGSSSAATVSLSFATSGPAK